MAPPASSNPSSFKNPFASGLGRAAWNYYDNQQNTADSFSKEEQASWNAEKKKKAPTAEQK
ncbi:hypothetical protein ACHAXT_004195 [Thalassiosira profunda]